MKKLLGVWWVTAVIAGCQSDKELETAPEDQENREEFSAVAKNLQSPWDIEAEGDRFFISERNGTIAKVEGDQVVREPVATDKPITQIGEGGLLGLKLHPKFQENQLAFAYHTYENEDDKIQNRLITLAYNNGEWKEQSSLLEKIPGNNFHNGGRIEIGQDGCLYVTTGDAQEESLAQDKDSLAGKILRMTLDGEVPGDNPEEGSYVYSYGHRNPQGLGWSKKGDLYASEHGPNNHDEVNKIEPGKNYGWPLIVGDETASGAETPLFETGNETWAPSGTAVHEETIYIASLRGSALRSLNLQGENAQVITSDYGRLRDVEIVGDSIYFITNNTDGRGNVDSEDDLLVRYDF
ncbi:sorbosone dehydrogenase family protein [Halobacillus sp. Marseille-Q1614]|uniref:PQQ-dependent sugar dehydrogenase n=1 Tax=Halobacillus sp. Marseille-Q1614 TaxID=2709134 RepID=UPI00156D70B1|nr:PQQ-dependent sugar dehydrogenase [Halobacillus sp. Marseille-Q1614]